MNVLAHRPKAIELALIQAGYSLADIRGERMVQTVREAPGGVAAAVGRVSPRSALGAAGCTLALGLIAALETGLLALLLASAALAYLLHLAGEYEPTPTEVEREVERPGMDAHEVQQRLVQWDEWQRLEKKAQEKEAKKAKNSANTGGSARSRRH